jgi:hypothetical protein
VAISDSRKSCEFLLRRFEGGGDDILQSSGEFPAIENSVCECGGNFRGAAGQFAVDAEASAGASHAAIGADGETNQKS